MTTAHDHSGVHPEPADGQPAAHNADELFSHGLLSHLSQDTPAARDARVRRLMDAIGAESRARSLRFPAPLIRRFIAAAAVIAICASAALFTTRSEASAQAYVNESIAALRTTGDRRFEVRIMREHDASLPEKPTATVDTRGGGLMLLLAQTPDGRELAVGRDSEGAWAVRPDGEIEREHPEIAWPKWASVGDESLFADSPDRLLEVLSKGYTMARRGTEELDGHAGRRFEHLVGEKKGRFLPGPSRVELWIDTSSKVVQRIELRWDDRDNPRPPRQGPGGGFNPDRRPPMDGAPAEGEGPDGGPPMDEPQFDGPPDGAPVDDRGAPGVRPADRPALDDNGFPADRPPRRALRPGPGPKGGLGGPPLGPGPGRPGPGGGPGGGPQFRPGPPRLLVIELVDAPVYEEAWFTPSKHTES